MYIAANIRFFRKKLHLSQPDLADMLGYKSFTTIQKWESGVSTPPFETFVKMAEIFDVDMDDLAKTDLSVRGGSYFGYSNCSVPVYGKIPAGVPIEAITDIDEYVPLSDKMSKRLEFFALRLNDNSMYPKYQCDDIVIFEKKQLCENGDECAIRLRGEDVSFKKILFEGNQVVLRPLNPDFVTIQFDHRRIDSLLEIIGIAREIRREV